jgi:Flp pilus assembly protein TadD
MGTNALAWNYLGLACHHSGANAEAAQAYQRALVLDRDFPGPNPKPRIPNPES